MRELTSPLVEPAAATLAAAFEVDSPYRYLFPGPERRQGLRDLFGIFLRPQVDRGTTWVTTEGEAVVATVTIQPPGRIPIAWRDKIAAAAPFAWTYGPSVMRRLMWLEATYRELEDHAALHQPHWHLHLMAVAPLYQGTGYGSALLKEVLARTLRASPEHPVVVTTHLERNLPFYHRAGFGVVTIRTMQPPGGGPYQVWALRRGATQARIPGQGFAGR